VEVEQAFAVGHEPVAGVAEAHREIAIRLRHENEVVRQGKDGKRRERGSRAELRERRIQIGVGLGHDCSFRG
jgi:hypothetical protein